MPGARRLPIVMFATAWIVGACVSVAPPAQTASPATLPSDAGAQPTIQTTASAPAVVEPTLAEPPTSEPTEPGQTTPTDPPTPTDAPVTTDPPTPTDPPAPAAQPNLKIQKFELVQEPVLAGASAALRADIVNYGNAAAGPFGVEFVSLSGEEELVLDLQIVDGGLAPGAATVLTLSITPDVAGELKLAARVDPIDQISESDETDNETDATVNVVQADVNLTLPPDGLTVSSALNPAAPTAYLFTISLLNTGQTTLTGPMSVKYFGYTDAGDYVEWGTFDFDLDLAPQGLFNQQVAWDVQPGRYRAYALADAGEVWTETIEDDNEAIYDFTAP